MSRPDTQLRALLKRHVDDGDEGAIEELVAATRPKLLAVARRIGNPQDADDAVQTAYLSLIRRGEPDAPILPWLITAVVRIAYRRKAQEHRQADLARALAAPAPPKTPVRLSEQSERQRLVREQIARLPAKYRDPIVLHYLEDLPTRDIARLLDLNEHTVRTRLRRARVLLRGPLAPAWLHALFILPWLARDAAAAPALGGIAVKKLAVVGVVLLLSLGWWTLRTTPVRERTEGDKSLRTAMSVGRARRDGSAPTAEGKEGNEAARPVAAATKFDVTVRGDGGRAIDTFTVKLKRTNGTVARELPCENGFTELSVYEPGLHRVAVLAEGYAPWESEPMQAPAPITATLNRGVVYDVTIVDDRNRAVPDARVRLIGPRSTGGTATSDAHGAVSIGGILPVRGKTLWYVVDGPDHHPHGGNLPLPDTPGRETATIRLTPSVPLTVRVVDHADAPAKGAAVVWRNAYPSLTRHYQTDSEGLVTFPIPHHMTGITIRARGRHGPTTSVQVSSVQVSWERKPVSTTIRLARADGVLFGTVRLPDGTETAGAQVGYTAASEPAGVWRLGTPLKQARFRISNLPSGPGRLHVLVPGFGAQAFYVDLGGGEERRFDATLHPGVVLEGVAVDPAGQPIRNADVTLRRALPVNKITSIYALMAQVATDADGRFRIAGLDAEPYMLQIRKRQMTVTAGQGLVRVVVRDDTVILRVRNKATGKPYSGRLTVDAGAWLAYPTRAAAGVYRMNAPWQGDTFDLEFTAPGFLPLQRNGVRFDTTPLDLTIELDPGAVVELRVLDEQRRPVADRGLHTKQGVLRTDDDGWLRLTGLTPGAHELRVGDPKSPLRFARVRAQAPGRADAILRLWAKLTVMHKRKWSDVTKARWQVYDEGGTLVAEKAPKPYRMSNAHEIPCFGFLFVPASGRYRVVADLDGRIAERTIDAVAGKEVTLRLDVTK